MYPEEVKEVSHGHETITKIILVDDLNPPFGGCGTGAEPREYAQ